MFFVLKGSSYFLFWGRKAREKVLQFLGYFKIQFILNGCKYFAFYFYPLFFFLI